MKTLFALVLFTTVMNAFAADLKTALIVYPQAGKVQKYTVLTNNLELPLSVMTMSFKAGRELDAISNQIDVFSKNPADRMIAIEYSCGSTLVVFQRSPTERLGSAEDDATQAVLYPQGGMMHIESTALPQ